MITRYTSPKVTEPAPELWSNCIVCDGIAYIAGLTSRNHDGLTIDGRDEYEQTKIIFDKHKALIEAAGGKMSDFTKLTIFVTDTLIGGSDADEFLTHHLQKTNLLCKIASDKQKIIQLD